MPLIPKLFASYTHTHTHTDTHTHTHIRIYIHTYLYSIVAKLLPFILSSVPAIEKEREREGGRDGEREREGGREIAA